MQGLKFIFLLSPILSFGQKTITSSSDKKVTDDFSDSRFDIDSNGFFGKVKADTTYYMPDKKIAAIINHAIDKKSRTAGNKVGLSTEYYFNGKIKSHGNYQMCSLLYCCSPKYKRIESSYKVGKWIYYYDTGQVMAIGEYKIINYDAHTGIPNQIGRKAAMPEEGWKFFNSDGSAASNTKSIIREMEYRPNCD